MGEEDFMKIHAALFATATDDEGDVAKDDDAAEIYTQYEEDEDDHEYDDWIENTYWMGDETQVFKEMIDKLSEAISKLEQAVDYMEDDEHRYYPEEYRHLSSLIGGIEAIVSPVSIIARNIEETAGEYSTW